MKWEPNLAIGQVITGHTLIKEFECESIGSLRRSDTKDCFILISRQQRNTARQSLSGVFYCTSSEAILERDVREFYKLVLKDHAENSIYYLAEQDENRFLYLGKVGLKGAPFKSTVESNNSEEMPFWVFPLVYIRTAGNSSSEALDAVENITRILFLTQTKKRKKKQGKKLTPLDRLQRRINNNFAKRIFLGDIIISDTDFALLIEYMKEEYRRMSRINNFTDPDRTFCVGMVQIGIRAYNERGYWPNFEKLLGISNIGGLRQGELNTKFENTLRASGKPIPDGMQGIKLILMHGFVANAYTNRLFDFLYDFYRLDLFQDIQNLDRDRLNEWIKVIERKDNTERTYKIVVQTADAVRANVSSAKSRLRWFLKLIDHAYRGDPLPCRNSNRLTCAFLDWVERSEQLKNDKANPRNYLRGDKRFATPTLIFDQKRFSFKIRLPQQIVSEKDAEDLHWDIQTATGIQCRDCNPYRVYTGCRTDEIFLDLAQDVIFDEINISLMSNEHRLSKTKIPQSKFRFFDGDGILVKDNHLSAGSATSFSTADFIPESTARLELMPLNSLYYAEYDFEDGDIVYLPDGNPLCVGSAFKEGLGSRGVVEDAYALIEDRKLCIYRFAPILYAQFGKEKLNGTKLEINGIPHMLHSTDPHIRTFDPMDRSNEMGYLIDLSDFGCVNGGVYRIKLDVPADRTNRNYEFLLAPGFEYEFEGKPYVYKDVGTISIPHDCLLTKTPDIQHCEVVGDRDYFDFGIQPNLSYIHLKYAEYLLAFKTPIFEYSFDDGESWHCGQPEPVWVNNLETTVQIRCPGKEIKVYMDDSPYEVLVEWNQEKNLFDCKLHDFKSYFDRQQLRYQLNLKIEGVEEPIQFLEIYTRSVIFGNSGCLNSDSHRDQIWAQFDIVGPNTVYADLYYDVELLAEKIQLCPDGRLIIPGVFKSGKYRVELFEAEDDDDGFGDLYYEALDQFSMELLNPYDISGKSIKVRSLCPREHPHCPLRLKRTYSMYNLVRIGCNSYMGDMVIRSINTKEWRDSCQGFLYIPDPENMEEAFVGFMQGDEAEGIFLYDDERNYMVLEEDKNVPRYLRYRRYRRLLCMDDYLFKIEFIDPTENELKDINKNPSEDSPTSNKVDISIYRLGLQPITVDILYDNSILDTKDLCTYSEHSLARLRYMDQYPSALEDIKKCLQENGLELTQEPSETDHISKTISASFPDGSKEYDPTEADGSITGNGRMSVIDSVLPGEHCEEKIQDDDSENESSLQIVTDSTLLKNTDMMPLVYNMLANCKIKTVGDLHAFVLDKGVGGLKNITGMKKTYFKSLETFVYINKLDKTEAE